MEVLTKYAGLARTLVLLALEREELAEQVRMATEARAIVRQALGEPTLELVLRACRSAVVTCFDAVGMWLTAFGVDGGQAMTSYSLGGGDVDPPFSDGLRCRCPPSTGSGSGVERGREVDEMVAW